MLEEPHHNLLVRKDPEISEVTSRCAREQWVVLHNLVGNRLRFMTRHTWNFIVISRFTIMHRPRFMASDELFAGISADIGRLGSTLSIVPASRSQDRPNSLFIFLSPLLK